MAPNFIEVAVAGAVVAVAFAPAAAHACRDPQISDSAFVAQSPAESVRKLDLASAPSIIRVKIAGEVEQAPAAPDAPRSMARRVPTEVLGTVEGAVVAPGRYVAEVFPTSCGSGEVAPRRGDEVWYAAGQLKSGRLIELHNFVLREGLLQ